MLFKEIMRYDTGIYTKKKPGRGTQKSMKEKAAATLQQIYSSVFCGGYDTDDISVGPELTL